jgi:thioredoxin reductase
MQSESTPVLEVDLVVVGAGPAGLLAAYYADFREWRSLWWIRCPKAGGKVMATYPEKSIYDIAGFPDVRGRDLVAGLREQAAPSSPATCSGTRRPG